MIDKNTCDPHLQGLSNQRAQAELAAMPHRVMEVERRSKHIVIHKHIEAKSKAGANTSRVVSTCEVVKKLQELLHDLFFVIVFFSSLSFYRGL